MAKQQQVINPIEIHISMLGCSNSGKTTFYSGIDQSLINNLVEFGDKHIHFNPHSVGRGTARYNAATDKLETEETTQVINAQDQLKGLSNNAAIGSSFEKAATAGGGSAFTNAGGSAFAAATKDIDKRQVNDININEGLTAVLKLNAELDMQLGLTHGFHAPTATTRYLNIVYDVQINQETKCRLVITDYAGELLSLNNAVPDSMLGMLTDHVKNSEAAILLASARDMNGLIIPATRDNPSMFSVNSAKAELGANRISALLTNIDTNLFTFLLAITQTDSPAIDPKIRNNNFITVSYELKEYIYNLSFRRASDMGWSTGIIPVSAIGTKRDGTPNVDDDNNLLPDHELNQVGIDKTILFCLYNAVLQKIKKLNLELKEMGVLYFLGGDEKRRRRKEIEQHMNDLIDLKTVLESRNGYFDGIYEKNCALHNVASLN